MNKLLASLAVVAITAGSAYAQGQTHKLAFQVDENDPAVMNLTLNNVENVLDYYKSQGDTAQIEVVAFGPGLNMYLKGKSPVAERIGAIQLAHPEVKFDACNNTLSKMEKAAGHKLDLLEEATVVPAGVVRLAELQQEGFAYIRP